jgi:glutamate---cysteine ligase / carboxylate-amine ligase
MSWSAAGGVAERFGAGPAYAVGVEEQLMLVTGDRHELAPAAPALLRRARWPVGSVARGQSDSMLELVTPICRCAAEARDVLRVLRGEVTGTGQTLLGAGIHPGAAFDDPGATAATDDALRGLARRTPCCAMHVHVGMPDRDTAVRAANGMRRWLPLLWALGANSPLQHGPASARGALIRGLSRTGVPRDVRPQPRLGTLEVRVPDAQSSLDDLAALVALIHCLSVHEATAAPRPCREPVEALDASCIRAIRDGRDARVRFAGAMRTIPEIAAEALERARHQAAALDCPDELRGIARLVQQGTGADRQRAAHRTGGLPHLLRTLVDETNGASARDSVGSLAAA